jgi:death on curing protein
VEPLFLSLDEVLAIHRDQIRRYGGSDGIRDLRLLESALAAPAASFDGEYLHSSLFEMAAAYLFHVSRNHPFLDGNKRAALAAALAFLWLNGYRLHVDPDELCEFVVSVASGEIEKSAIASFLKRHSRRF